MEFFVLIRTVFRTFNFKSTEVALSASTSVALSVSINKGWLKEHARANIPYMVFAFLGCQQLIDLPPLLKDTQS